jgi:outer membrane lipoprotein SlyB
MPNLVRPSSRPLPRAALAASLLGLGLSLAACGPQDGEAVQSARSGTAVAQATPRPAVDRSTVGAISAIEPIVTSQKPSGAGAVIGGVVGAAIGNQIGDGSGRKAATVLGAVGGAAAGHEIEKRRSQDVTGFRVAVRLDNGETRSFTRTNVDGLAVGQRVRVVAGELRPA